MAAKFKATLSNIISHYQSVFIDGRKITDNVAIAMECFKAIRSNKERNHCCAVKLDLSQAFDRVEWLLLIDILSSLGYSQDWCNLILECISTTSVFALFDGAMQNSTLPVGKVTTSHFISLFSLLSCSLGCWTREMQR